ncbi:hypothetical protein B0H14DRAFT_2587658 [Mycena olivaceomarginata]|nr:hypothetical protein B0H14DRAFT_2587658 [Mycena olivaceomarginata]
MFAMANLTPLARVGESFSTDGGKGEVSKTRRTDEFRVIGRVIETPNQFLAVAFRVGGSSSVDVNGLADLDVEVIEVVVVGDSRWIVEDVPIDSHVGVDESWVLEVGADVEQRVARIGRGESTTIHIGHRIGFLPRHLRTKIGNKEIGMENETYLSTCAGWESEIVAGDNLPRNAKLESGQKIEDRGQGNRDGKNEMWEMQFRVKLVGNEIEDLVSVPHNRLGSAKNVTSDCSSRPSRQELLVALVELLLQHSGYPDPNSMSSTPTALAANQGRLTLAALPPCCRPSLLDASCLCSTRGVAFAALRSINRFPDCLGRKSRELLLDTDCGVAGRRHCERIVTGNTESIFTSFGAAEGGMGSDFKASVAHIVPHDATTTPAAGSIIYKKMKVAELKAAGLDKDPVYAYTISTLLPLYLAKANDATYQGALVDYVKSDLFNKIATDLDIAAKGYNLGAFKEAKAKGRTRQTPVPGPQPKATATASAKPPAATSALEEFRQRYKEEITEAANAKLAGEPRTPQAASGDGGAGGWQEGGHCCWPKPGTSSSVSLSSDSTSNGMETEFSDRNQADAGNKIFKLLKAQIGTGWGQIGNAVFYCFCGTGKVDRGVQTVARGQDVVRPVGEDNAAAKRTYDEGRQTRPGIVSRPSTWMRQMWRRSGRSWGPCWTKCGDRWSCPSITLRIEGQFEVALDEADDHEVREYCRHLFQVQKQGGHAQVTTGAKKTTAGGTVLPPPPAHEDRYQRRGRGYWRQDQRRRQRCSAPAPAPLLRTRPTPTARPWVLATRPATAKTVFCPAPRPPPPHETDTNGAAVGAGDKTNDGNDGVLPPPPPPSSCARDRHQRRGRGCWGQDQRGRQRRSGPRPRPLLLRTRPTPTARPWVLVTRPTRATTVFCPRPRPLLRTRPTPTARAGAPGNEHMNGGRADAPPTKVKRGRKPAVKKTVGPAKKSANPGAPPAPKKRGRPAKETDENVTENNGAENNVAEDRPAKRHRVAGGPEAAAARQARGYARSPRKRGN